MILEIQHETRFEYSEPVTESLTEVRMEPAIDLDQSCCSFHLSVSPPTDLFRYQDGFCNRVHHYNLRASHREVRILAASIVETHPRPKSLETTKSTWPIDLEGAGLEVLDFLRFRGPVRESPRLAPLIEELLPRAGMNLGELLLAVSRYIRTHFEYAREVTLASSPIDDVLEQGKGVCQDFTHLMIALLRAFQVPARYISGYVHRPNKDSQSHAWCEAWVPDLGWVGIDPTNDCVVNDHFIKVGVGRDFTDVPPNKGVYRGRGQEAIFVRVETRALERLPSVAWQEQLPPLNVPLVPIVLRSREEPRDEDSEQQQQQ
jgi:transglutaminase-like putative cysteine protease